MREETQHLSKLSVLQHSTSLFGFIWVNVRNLVMQKSLPSFYVKPVISHDSLAPLKRLLSVVYTLNVIRKEMFVLLRRVSDSVSRVFYKLKRANCL